MSRTGSRAARRAARNAATTARIAAVTTLASGALIALGTPAIAVPAYRTGAAAVSPEGESYDEDSSVLDDGRFDRLVDEGFASADFAGFTEDSETGD